jgi:S-adenosylmethionine synthetase
VARPVGLFVDTYGTCKVKGLKDGQIAEKIAQLFDLRPAKIVERYGLRNPIFSETAAYGHMGRSVGTKEVVVDGQPCMYETFTWEKLDMVVPIREAFGLVEVAAEA